MAKEKAVLSQSGEVEERILMEPYEYICQVPGKQIRLQLIEAFNYWLQIPQDKLQTISNVVQMLHNASLLIDDIEDNSKLRRGIPVAHSIYGTAHTINCANYVYFKGLATVLMLNHPECTRIFTEQLLELHQGQGMDIYWRDTTTCPTEEEYKVMVKKKTGGLFGLAVKLMQLFSDNKSDFVPLSDTLGLYFQIRDDFANLMSKEYTENKSYCEDLTEGKFSFPIIHGVHHEQGTTQILSILRQKTTDLDVKKYCVDYLQKLGSFEYTKDVLSDLEEQAVQQIQAHGGNPYLSAMMVELCKVHKQQAAQQQH
ncbi:PREDICTED: geranylgeranyl pyrophosphate synthase-like [Branchiostoma belcheri]|uniref:Geranylgeranyl pyrophosphate synthase n=1 Tax=Branchiostoma belcheri TaxID=7741 RepID=A0A6P4YUE0_BRABE|nr:PREDICTED: geranylgeranyl pyrophosphate synthase-like [Branchiostoma belcheri]